MAAILASLVALPMVSGVAGELETVLILQPESSDAEMSVLGIREEIGGELRVKVRVTHAKTTVRDLQRFVAETSPSVVVIHRSNERLYRQFQLSRVGGKRLPATIVMNGENTVRSAAELSNSTVLNYGVAGVTSLVNLRSILHQPLKRVGVVYRAESKDYIQEQKQLAAQEKIELVAKVVDENATDTELRDVLNGLLKEGGVDALWVLNDDVLLSSNRVANSWLPVLRPNKKPVVVNSPTLVNAKLRFGTFGVFPDHVAVGAQVGNMVFELRDRDWRVEENSFEDALSVRKVLLMSLAKEQFALRMDALAQLDQVIQ